MERDLSTFLRNTGPLPSLPAIYYDLTQAVQNPNSSISAVGNIIRKDQSLTSRILKLANSALYSFPSQIGTIEEAVQLLGMREIQDLALATCVIRLFSKLPLHLVDVVSFWKHSIACGTASALLAEEQHDPSPERFFVGGLLHDIGRLILFLKAPEDCQDILRRCEVEAKLVSSVEKEILGFDHARLGAELLASWKMPVSLCEMVQYHHHPAGARLAMVDAFIIHQADFITSALDMGRHGEYLIAPLELPRESQHVLLAEHRIEPLVAELEEKCAQLFPILT